MADVSFKTSLNRSNLINSLDKKPHIKTKNKMWKLRECELKKGIKLKRKDGLTPPFYIIGNTNSLYSRLTLNNPFDNSICFDSF